MVVKPKALKPTATNETDPGNGLVPLAAVTDLLRSVVPLGGPAVARQILEALDA